MVVLIIHAFSSSAFIFIVYVFSVCEVFQTNWKPFSFEDFALNLNHDEPNVLLVIP